MTEPAEGRLPEGAWLWLHDFGRWLGRTLFRFGYRMRVRGLDRMPRSGPVVVVANHSSLADGQMLFGLLDRRIVFLIKHEMFRGPLGWALRRLGQLAVRRGQPDRTPLLAAVRVLRAGGVIGIFPEGTRSADDVATAEHGAAWLARSAGALVLPVACRGIARPPGTRRRFRPVVDVLVGDPFELPAGKGRAELALATEQVRTSLVALLAELDRTRGKQEDSKDAGEQDLGVNNSGVSGEQR
ncbi:lysophospholipid acyltransferase family protein [Goodfellowiella coeruleoviolacea]|uniref:1-acyl-sn-glycerol-3-phosphate acyltransferase n=1 Tax=Goodfellowiella coeruleoviolacea TaxID=334858 RepID=A0AAE3GKX0_9PSEU|nr:lysophospholipid acyltransferase family protein [Goodfellowiella coeruleoviolacea]MCP2170101.1 1-acyl-sn-glycerol-3-phosphate acyltransferase [Goodfellowiella coeruleoviolacea]